MDISIAAAADHSEAESFDDVANLNRNNNMNQNQTDTDLERCGRWLMAIPRDDVVALQQTSEYREFLVSFDKLGEVCYMNYMHCKYICIYFMCIN